MFLVSAAALLIGAIAVPAAQADVTVTQTFSPQTPIAGTTATVHTTITNGPTAEPDLRAHVRLTRPGSQAIVRNNIYESFTASQGTCTIVSEGSVECSFGALPANAEVQLNAAIETNKSFEQTVAAYRCTAPPVCDSQTSLGTGGSITVVSHPTIFSGSSRVKLKGLPQACTNRAFTANAKVKGKKVSRVAAYLKGPKSEFGNALPGRGVSGRIAKTKKRKLRVTIPGDELDPGFYNLTVAAKRKSGRVKKTARFQVCGPTFGL
jgi:hypothetical protein